MRTFDEICSVISTLTKIEFLFTQKAVEDFLQYGSSSMLQAAAHISTLTPEEIIFWWYQC